MLRKLTKVIFMGTVIIRPFFCNAENIAIKHVSGDQAVYKIADVQKLTFSGGNMIVTRISGISNVFAFSAISNINFSATAHVYVPEYHSISLTPLKRHVIVSKTLSIPLPSGSSTGYTVKIFALSGKLLMTKLAMISEKSGNIDVGMLPAGLYMGRISNGEQTETITFIKK